MNEERMLELAEFIKDSDDFDMMSGPFLDGSQKCIAGHARQLFGKDDPKFNPTRFLGLTPGEGRRLFAPRVPREKRYDYRAGPDDYGYINKELAAHAIGYFVRRKEFNWEHAYQDMIKMQTPPPEGYVPPTRWKGCDCDN